MRRGPAARLGRLQGNAWPLGDEPKHCPRARCRRRCKVFEMISTAKVAKSAAEARDMLVLRPHDRITMNRYRLLADAKARALNSRSITRRRSRAKSCCLGPPAGWRSTRQSPVSTKRAWPPSMTCVVSGELARVLTGGDTDVIDRVKESSILELEREVVHSPAEDTWNFGPHRTHAGDWQAAAELMLSHVSNITLAGLVPAIHAAQQARRSHWMRVV